MIRNITFSADDLDFIKSLKNSEPKLDELTEKLKNIAKELVSDDTVCIELSDELIQQAVLAENKWLNDSGIINHIAIQFFHDC
jgi:hypothetical protein